MSLSTRLKTVRGPMTQQELANRLGVSTQAVSQWETGKTRPGHERLRAIAEVTRTDFHWLIDDNQHEMMTSRPGIIDNHLAWKAPVIDNVSAGKWTEIVHAETFEIDNQILYLSYEPRGQFFALRIMGESMMPRFRENDLIVIDTGIRPLPGDFVVAKLDESTETTFKKYRPRKLHGDEIIQAELVPLNDDYPTLEISAAAPGIIVGVMVEHRSFRRQR